MSDRQNDNSPGVNPMVPSSTGALLAEEWSINPSSALPSFLESVMIEEARRSGWQALKSFLIHLERRLSSLEPSSSRWSRIQRTIARFFADRILKPYSPEIRFLIFYTIERRYLTSKSGASIFESLYGGKRVRLGLPEPLKDGATKQRSLKPISKQDGVKLAFLLTLGPYLAERTEKLYQNLSFPSETFPPSFLRLKKMVKVLYPFLHMSIQGIHLLHQWKYLLGRSLFFDPYSQWLSLVVRRVTAQDLETPDSNSDRAQSKVVEDATALSKKISGSKTFRKISFGILSSAIALSWLARLRSTMQEIQQQRQARQQSQNSIGSTVPIPLPPRRPSAEMSPLSNCPSNVCPLCRQPRINPTASTGGFVFCLKCLLSYVKENGVCPISGKECPETSIVRLFEPRQM